MRSLTFRNIIYDLEAIMLRVLSTALLAGATIFVAGVIYGWWYGMLLAFLILIAINMIGMVNR
jgi:hypothetical protein